MSRPKDTNLRYELPHEPSKLFVEYTKNVQNNAILNDKGDNEKSLERKELYEEWLARNNLKIRARTLKNEKKFLEHECKMVNKANLMVRKRALELRLEADQKMYTEELARFGKAFHTERV